MSDGALYPTSTVRYREVDGLAVLMDLSAGDYLQLDRVATSMWSTLISTPEPRARLARLAAELDAPAERLAGDLASFHDECLRRGLLQREPPAPPRRRWHRLRRRRGPWTARAWWSLLATRRRLLHRGFAETFAAYSHLPRPGASSSGNIPRAERAFRWAETLTRNGAARDDCLPRSLALYRFLLSVGVPADLCIGVRRRPFEAHAWVETGGRVVADSAEEVALFTELSRT